MQPGRPNRNRGPLHVTIPRELIKKLDERRGVGTRSAVVEEALRQALGENPEPRGASEEVTCDDRPISRE
jgi:metal-responsive CopG/Arc/MetJ family transcriptional regulator